MGRPNPYPYNHQTSRGILFGSNDPLVLRTLSCKGCISAGSQVPLAEVLLEDKPKDDIIIVRCLGRESLGGCGISIHVVSPEQAAEEIDNNEYTGFTIEQLDDLYYS